eukprot:gene6784-8417_t
MSSSEGLYELKEQEFNIKYGEESLIDDNLNNNDNNNNNNVEGIDNEIKEQHQEFLNRGEVSLREVVDKIVSVLKGLSEGIENGTYKETIDLFKPFITDDKFNLLKEAHFEYQQLISTSGSAAKLTKLQPTRLGSKDTAANSSGGSNGDQKKRRSNGRSSGGINMKAIVKLLSNMTMDQFKSMVDVLIMVLLNTRVDIILRELHRFNIVLSVVFDLFSAIYRFNISNIAINIIIATMAVLSYINRKDKTLMGAVSISKYIQSAGNKKSFLFVRFMSLCLFISNLYKIVNPPPLTPNDLISIVKSQLSNAKL